MEIGEWLLAVCFNERSACWESSNWLEPKSSERLRKSTVGFRVNTDHVSGELDEKMRKAVRNEDKKMCLKMAEAAMKVNNQRGTVFT